MPVSPGLCAAACLASSLVASCASQLEERELGSGQSSDEPAAASAWAGDAGSEAGDELVVVSGGPAPRAPATGVVASIPRPVGPDETGHAVAADADGNVWVAGFSEGSLDGQPVQGGRDGFVIAYDAAGQKLWTRMYGTSGNDLVQGIAVLGAGEVVIAGRAGAALTSDEDAGAGGAFVARLDAQGEPRWVRQFGEPGAFSNSIASSPQGTVCVAGVEQYQPTLDRAVAVLSCFDANGVLLFRDRWGGTPAAESVAVAVNEDSVYVVGSAGGSFDESFWQGAGGAFVTRASLRRYTPAGMLVWERVFGPDATRANGVAIDADGGAIVAGETFGAFAGFANRGARDAFLASFDLDGEARWTEQLGTLGWDDAQDVLVLAQGDLLVAGNAIGELDDNPHTGHGGYLMRCDARGKARWVRQGFADVAAGLAADARGRAFVTGWFFNQAGGEPSFEVDAYQARFDPEGILQSRLVIASRTP